MVFPPFCRSAVLVGAAFCLVLAAGCHGDTAQGGGRDSGHATPPAHVQVPANVTTPPTADQVDPDSPRAVLDGTSTTQNQLRPRPALRPSHP